MEWYKTFNKKQESFGKQRNSSSASSSKSKDHSDDENQSEIPAKKNSSFFFNSKRFLRGRKPENFRWNSIFYSCSKCIVKKKQNSLISIFHLKSKLMVLRNFPSLDKLLILHLTSYLN